jgi:hypothetical protein
MIHARSAAGKKSEEGKSSGLFRKVILPSCPYHVIAVGRNCQKSRAGIELPGTQITIK